MFPDPHYERNDPTYLHQGVYGECKESFRRILDLIQERFGKTPISLVDVGCATGSFLFHAKKNISGIQCTGVDISEEHLAFARREMPDVDWIQQSVLDPSFLSGRKFDVCTCLGTNSVFDNLEPVMKNLWETVSPSTGVLYIFDLVNEDPVDVIVRFRKIEAEASEAERNEKWNTAFNTRSQRTYQQLVSKLKDRPQVKFHNFEMPFALPKSEDPLRAWTIETQAHPHQLVVGTGQLLNFKIVEISRAIP